MACELLIPYGPGEGHLSIWGGRDPVTNGPVFIDFPCFRRVRFWTKPAGRPGVKLFSPHSI